jgi:hypothetical protein
VFFLLRFLLILLFWGRFVVVANPKAGAKSEAN